jgi:hypothetical protein
MKHFLFWAVTCWSGIWSVVFDVPLFGLGVLLREGSDLVARDLTHLGEGSATSLTLLVLTVALLYSVKAAGNLLRLLWVNVRTA